MKVKQAGVWKTLSLRIKHLGAWCYPYRTLVKHNGVWKDDYLKGILNSLYNGTVTIGTVTSSYVVYGYSTNLGSANPTASKFVNKMVSLITGSKPYYGAPAYQWMEMVIEGSLMHVANQIGDITINGNYGRLVSVSEGTSGGARTFIGWVFDKPLSLSGQWSVNT